MAETGAGGEEERPNGRGDLILGALVFSLGSTVTVASFLAARPGEKYLLAYGAIIGGVLQIARGFYRWWKRPTPLPILAMVLAMTVPPVGAVGAVAISAWQDERVRNAGLATEAALRAAELAQQVEDNASTARGQADEARLAEQRQRADHSLEVLRTSTDSDSLCRASLQLGRAGAREAIPDLKFLLEHPEPRAFKLCAAGALADLGEVDVAIAFYTAAAEGTDDNLRRGALGGFGDIGPRAATVALPHFATAMASPNAAYRFVAVNALSKLGRAAEPLLQQAAQDPDPMVRDLASRSLNGLPRAE